MRCLIDTNVLLRGLDRNHSMRAVVRRALISLRRQDDLLYLAVQNMIEFWAVATRPVDSNGLGMSIQWASTQLGRLKQFFAVLPESADTFPEWERLVVQYQVSGKKTHDTHLVAVMNVHRITHIMTFNGADFARYPGISVIQPQNFDLTQEQR